ncbi:N-acetyltransferase eco [Malaya genurostris]|uniref:N-acetyltransferase eco n=1 Tax=Malaya genurostris TaxID=325434 RepID=UPI0026F406F2|nr:N-acetyltransferase eco [Malaya genurostris]
MRKQVTFDQNKGNSLKGTVSVTTPQNETVRITRSKYVPTPKMTGRKKALFYSGEQTPRGRSKSLEEDSDLGPMSPLKFSNSPKKPSAKALNITTFRNILGNASPESDRSLSPDYERRFSHSERYEILPVSYGKENLMSDEETRLSFPSGTPRVRTPAQSALLDETNSNSLSILMSSDLNIAEKRPHLLKTPGLSEANFQKEPKITFRKFSLHENTLTPSTKPETRTLGEPSESKARTSLSFNDLRPISTKSFYSSANVQLAAHRHVPRTNQSLPCKMNAKIPRQRSSSYQQKRAKTRSSSVRLGSFNKGVFHKIKKPTIKKSSIKKMSTSQVIESTSSMLKVSLENTGESKSAPSTPQESKLFHQLDRIRHISKDKKKSVEQVRQLSKSMTDLSSISVFSNDAGSDRSDEDQDDDEQTQQYDSDDAKSEGGIRKFFKANSRRRVRREYKIVNNVSATVRKGGKISLKQNKEKKRKYQSLFDEEFDFESEQLEVDDIISKLNQSQVENIQPTIDHKREFEKKPIIQPSINTVTQVEVIDAPQSDISNDEPIPMQSNIIFVDRFSPLIGTSDGSTSLEEENINRISHHESPATQIPALGSEVDKKSNDQLHESQLPGRGNQKLFPIFDKNHQAIASEFAPETITNLFDPQRKRQKRFLNSWKPIGSNQYQIDAGQKDYGAQQCRECGLVYSVHEPEEELIHENFHNSQHVLRFGGWINEPIIAHVPEWDVSGRILAITIAEGKMKLQKVNDVLAVVDRELGYIEPCQLFMGSVVYMAVARSLVLGVCVAQPLQQANRLLSIEGIYGSIDCCTMETFPAKCGISRIWVSPNFRGYGIARTLLTVMKSHFIFGYPLSYDEIAFSAPTEAGKRLAESVTGRKDFLIYM